MGYAPRPLIERTLIKIKFPDNLDECWEWIAGCDGNGYGKIRLGPDEGNRIVKAHFVVYRHFVGEPPPGLEPDHLCRNVKCVNYAHLEYVTHKVNMNRSNAPSAIRRREGKCHRGHVYNEENTYYRKNGSAQCRICPRKLA